MIERFGPVILDGEGAVSRAEVAKIVFADREALRWLEALLHPLASREYLEWREALARLPEPPAVCVTEVPLLYEAGSEERFDAVVVVTAPPEIRAARTRVRRDDREQRLLPDEEKLSRADFGYVNTGSLDDLDAFVARVLERLLDSS